MDSASFGTDTIGHQYTLDAYAEVVCSTDNSGQTGQDALSFAFQGLFGEIGSLMSEVKKRRRDGEAYSLYGDAVREEVGDALWYLTHLGQLLGLSLSSLAAESLRTGLQDTPSPASFRDLQTNAPVADAPRADRTVDYPLRQLALSVGAAMREIDPSEALPITLARARIVEVLRHLASFCDAAGVSLQDCADQNARKALDRWPGVSPAYPPLFDESEAPGEQLPRKFSVHFSETTFRGSSSVVQRCNGIVIGDRLTDNMHYDDGYRFHDCFHLSYAAVLGWSPVLRALFRCKRKSNPNPRVDEVEDGQRAQIIEEGISTWVFNYAGPDCFANTPRLDYSLLKEVRRLSKGLEVESRPLWLWEQAILRGYKVFRALRAHQGGWVDVDLENRSITYAPTASRPIAPLGQ